MGIAKCRKILKDSYAIMYKNDPETLKIENEKLDNLSDNELKKQIENDQIYFYVKPFKSASLKDVKKWADYLGIELDEKLILPSHGNIVTENPVPVGWHPVKFLEQLVFKKTVTSHDIAEIDPITGQSTSSSKTRMVSGPELINMFSYPGLPDVIFPEYLAARSDDKQASVDMHKQISETGRFSTTKMSTSGINQTQRTMSYYLLGAGIDNDIIPDTELKKDGKQMDIRKVES